MQKHNKLVLLALLMGLPALSHSQTTTNSIYSRFGLGDIVHRGTGQTYTLGGTGMGIRTRNNLNPLNPASYSSIDTMSFIFDMGFMGNSTLFETNEGSLRFNTGGISHINMGFPVTKNFKLSSGLMPFSRSGYYIKDESIVPGSLELIDYYYKGEGGLNQFYLGGSVELFRHVSAGLNASYIFGSLDRTDWKQYPEDAFYIVTRSEKHTIVKDYSIQFGIQAYDTIGSSTIVTLGGSFQPSRELKARFDQFVYTHSSVDILDPNPIDTVDLSIGKTSHVSLPGSYAAGIGIRTQKLMFAFDYYMQDWTKSNFLGVKDSLGKNTIYSAGIEFIPKINSLENYFSKVRYRLGGYYSTTYLQVKGVQIKDYGIRFGVGLPYKNSFSIFNLGFEVGQRGTLESGLMREMYYQMNFSMSLHDFWFIKRKFD